MKEVSSVVGTLDGERGALQGDGFSERGKTARTPLKLIMPNQIRSIRYVPLYMSLSGEASSVYPS